VCGSGHADGIGGSSFALGDIPHCVPQAAMPCAEAAMRTELKAIPLYKATEVTKIDP